MIEMAEAGGDCNPLGRENFSIAQMKRKSGLGTFEQSDSLVIQVGCKSLLEGQAICTKIFDANRSTKIGVFDVALFAIGPKGEVASGSITCRRKSTRLEKSPFWHLPEPIC